MERTICFNFNDMSYQEFDTSVTMCVSGHAVIESGGPLPQSDQQIMDEFGKAMWWAFDMLSGWEYDTWLNTNEWQFTFVPLRTDELLERFLSG